MSEGSIDNEKAAEVLTAIERSEREIFSVYATPVSKPGQIGFQHLYLFGVARRAVAQSVAFRQMIDAKNSIVAQSLIRLQLDTLLRLYALFWVEDPEAFAKLVFEGKSIDKIKAADGSLMKDSYLRNRVAAKNDWIPSVYAETSGYIHFSHRHMKAALSVDNELSGMGAIIISPYDVDKPIGYYGELLRAFLHINMMIPVAAADWFTRIDADGSSVSFGEVPQGESTTESMV
jgi:hypothetical protein